MGDMGLVLIVQFTMVNADSIPVPKVFPIWLLLVKKAEYLIKPKTDYTYNKLFWQIYFMKMTIIEGNIFLFFNKSKVLFSHTYP